uniref:hypothetical protein n=1 Tax=Spiroplasma endosymbiont of Amphibalanus improvisus TaxID=3066327 RepID=UPI00313E8CC3
MRKNKSDWEKVNKLTKTITFPKWWKKASSIFFTVIFFIVGGTSAFFGIEGLAKYFDYDDLHFHGDWIPSQDFCDFMKKIGVDVPVCKTVYPINLGAISIRDTDYEEYVTHNDTNDTQNYTGSDAQYKVVGKNGQIKSNNLRYEYVYNTIVNQIVSNSDIFPDMSNAYVSGIYSTSNVQEDTPENFLKIEDVTSDQLNINQEWTIEISQNPNDPDHLNMSFPVFIYNNSTFLNNFANFYLSYYAQTDYQDVSNQVGTFVQGESSRSILVTNAVINKSKNDNIDDKKAINDYLYNNFNIFVNNIYKYHIQEFQPWNKQTSTIDDVDYSQNPFGNFIINYTPNINSFDQTKIIDNPNNPNNSLDPQNQTYLTADQVNQNCLVSLLYLPVSDKDQDGTYDFNLQSIIQMINDSDMTLDEFIKIIQDIENGNTQEFLKLISEMPELMDMNALP